VKKSSVFLLPIIIGLSACSRTPDCGSSEVASTIGDIASENNLMNDEIKHNDIKNNGDKHIYPDQQIKPKLADLMYKMREIIIKVAYPYRDQSYFDDDWVLSMGSMLVSGQDHLVIPPGEDSKKYVNYYKEYKSITSRVNDDYKSLFSKEIRRATYKIVNSIMTYQDQSTGMVMCKATLHVSLDGWGEADQDIVYKVEKTTDGKLVVTLEQ